MMKFNYLFAFSLLLAVLKRSSAAATQQSQYSKCIARTFNTRCLPKRCTVIKKDFDKTLRGCNQKDPYGTAECLAEATMYCKGRGGDASARYCTLMENGWKTRRISAQACWNAKTRCDDKKIPKFMCKRTDLYPSPYSCNGWRACTANTPRAVVAKKGCNGRNSCYKNDALLKVGKKSCGGSSSCTYNDGMTIGQRSCRADSSCSSCESGTIIGNDACNGRATCINIQPNVKIGNGACNKISVCNDCTKDVPPKQQFCDTNIGAVNISPLDKACGGGLANTIGVCKENMGNLTVGKGSCKRPQSCSDNQGDVTIGNQSCKGAPGCCSANKKLVVGDRSCIGANTFTACEGNYRADLIVGNDSCNSPTDGNVCNALYNADRVEIGNRSCNGNFACQYLKGNVKIGNDACNGFKACQSCPSGTVVPDGQDSC